MLVDGLDFLLSVGGIIDLLLDFEVQLPGGVRHLKCLSLLGHLLCKLGEQVVGAEVREEGVGAALAIIEILGGKADNLGLRTIISGLVHVVVAQINLAIQVEVTAGRVADLGALCGLAFLFSEGTIFVDLVAACELIPDRISACGITAGQPWVANDVGNAEALVGVELEHASDQVLEFLGVEAFGLALRVGVSLPEEVGSVRGEQLVVVVLLVGHAEGWVSRIEDEENDAKGKQVNDLTLVWLLGQNLRSHVAWRADLRSVGAGAVATFKWASEAEVDDLNVIHLVEEDIFRFQVSVREALRVDVVDALQDLLEEILADFLREGARVRDVVEELTASDHLLSNVGDLDLLSVLLIHGRVLLELEILDNVSMVKLVSCLDFFLQKLEGLLVELWVIQAEDLKGIFGAILGSSELDLGREARAKGSSEGESVKSCRHMYVCVFG